MEIEKKKKKKFKRLKIGGRKGYSQRRMGIEGRRRKENDKILERKRKLSKFLVVVVLVLVQFNIIFVYLVSSVLRIRSSHLVEYGQGWSLHCTN